jgi:hypothetical protein
MKLDNKRLRERKNKYFTRLHSLLSENRDKRHISGKYPLCFEAGTKNQMEKVELHIFDT